MWARATRTGKKEKRGMSQVAGGGSFSSAFGGEVTCLMTPGVLRPDQNGVYTEKKKKMLDGRKKREHSFPAGRRGRVLIGSERGAPLGWTTRWISLKTKRNSSTAKAARLLRGYGGRKESADP